MPGTLLILSGRHRPLEIAVLLASLFTGLLGLFGTSTRTVSAIDLMLPGYGWVWFAAITLGSTIALGSLPLKIPSSLIWERIGLSILATFFLGYTFAALTFAGGSGIRGSVYLLAFGLGALFRGWQISRDLKKLAEAVEASK